LKPETHSGAPPLIGSVRPSRTELQPGSPARPPAALAGLVEATDSYSRPVARPRSALWRIHAVWVVSAALVVGLALVLGGRFVYRCQAVLHVPGGSDELDSHRRGLLDYAWSHANSGERDDLPRWAVDSPKEGVLRLTLMASRRRLGLDQARAVAEGYVAAARAASANVHTTPSEGETVLSELTTELEARLCRIETQVDGALAELPSTDPRVRRRDQLMQMQAARDAFAAVRSELEQARAVLAELQRVPAATHAIVASDERRAALEADSALQQDLRELEVRLTEMRSHLLQVRQQSADLLGQVLAAAGVLPQSNSAGSGRFPLEQRQRLERYTAAARRYHELATSFTESWNNEFSAMQGMKVDALGGELLESDARIRSFLNNFLFQAAKELAEIRGAVQEIEEGAADQARQHVLESDLVRGYQTVQSAHHRFEVAAGAIEPRDNFRLDASLQGARGLRRRSQQRIQQIDQQLQAEATCKAKLIQAQELQAGEERVGRLQAQADERIEVIVRLQEELDLDPALDEEFLKVLSRAENAGGRLQGTGEALAEARNRLRDLAVGRTGAGEPAGPQVISCGAAGTPVNLNERLWTGGLGAVLALLTVYGTQWWMARRA